MSMIKSKFAFLQVKIESVFLESPKTNQSSFSKSPKAFYSIDMRVFVGKFVMRLLDTKVLLAPQIDKSVIASPPIRVNDAFKVN